MKQVWENIAAENERIRRIKDGWDAGVRPTDEDRLMIEAIHQSLDWAAEGDLSWTLERIRNLGG